MGTWQNIGSAPKDRVIRVRRIHEGRLVFDGDAIWRKQCFEATPPHPIDGDVYPAYVGEGWMYPDKPYRVPEPTQWLPS